MEIYSCTYFLSFLLSRRDQRKLNFSLDKERNNGYNGNMPRGRRCRTLTASQIARLERFRRRGDIDHPNGFTYPQLKLSMNGNFKLDVLLRGMAGKPVWERYYAYIAEWLDRFMPERPIMGRKAAASGERPEEPEVDAARVEELAGKQDLAPELGDAEKSIRAARTLRGSR